MICETSMKGMKFKQRQGKKSELFRGWIFAAVVWAWSVGSLFSHPISMSSVIADIGEESIQVEMRILVEDLALYHELSTGDDLIYKAENLKQAAKDHEEFLLKYFVIRNFDGQRLEGEVTQSNLEEIPDEGVHASELMTRSIYYSLVYSLEEPKPEYLNFTQQFGGENAALPAVMTLSILQEGVLLEGPTELMVNTPLIVEMDWDGARAERPKTWRERKKQRDEKKEEKLGITSYSSTYSYFYITNQEVRHEVLIPLLTLEKWIEVQRADPEFLEVEEQEAAREPLEAFFAEHGKVYIDGVEVQPIIERLDFYGLDFRDFALSAPRKRVSVYNARAGVILTYPAKNPPREVKFTWSLFNEHTPFLRTVAYILDQASEQHFFTPNKPEFQWTREGELPVVSLQEIPEAPQPATLTLPLVSIALGLGVVPLLIVGALRRSMIFFIVAGTDVILAAALVPFVKHTIPDPFEAPPVIEQATTDSIVQSLHHNIYRAFDYRDESDIYDALEQSVSGDLLEALYIDIRNGLRMREQGGAVSRVKSVEMLEAQREDSSDVPAGMEPWQVVDYVCRWNVEGVVEHWGHIHTQVNQYRARFTMAALPESGWRITDLEILDESREKFQTGLRDFR